MLGTADMFDFPAASHSIPSFPPIIFMASELDTLGLDAAITILDQKLEAARAGDAEGDDIREIVGLIHSKWGSIDVSQFQPHDADAASETMAAANNALDRHRFELAAHGIDLRALRSLLESSPSEHAF